MVRFEIPGLPPSSNNAYFNLPKGGRTLTRVGKKYKHETSAFLARQYPKELQYFRPNEPYLVAVRLTFTGLQNKTWGREKGAENRYKKLDATNRTKLLEDVLAAVTGVDDSSTMTFVIQKCEGSEEKTEVRMWSLEREEDPLYELFQV